ncbi:hypothetical protein [Streptomyces sp. T12]|uniref:hypothetical protein n=1 Tax=Streptomyces sp. T12 TaxID=477697 RepID=UPI00119EA8D9|nr:hypothetical protein [Streptomyces sp. T12]
MSAPASAGNSIETATALLEAELGQLKERQEALQRQHESIQMQLASVSGHIESIRGALAALSAVPTASAGLVPRPYAGGSQTSAGVVEPEASDVLSAPANATVAAQDEAVPDEVRAPMDETDPLRLETGSPSASIAVPTPQSGGRFTEQVIAVLARHPDTALRARDVAEALGRDGSAGSINAVRSTLDRLVGTSRAHRVGKGLYRAKVD